MRAYLGLTLCLALLAVQPLHAQQPPVPGGEALDIFSIHVVVGPSERDLDTLGVFLPECDKDGPKMCGTLLPLLKKDLEITGLFRLLKDEARVFDPARETFDETNWGGWFDSGARYVIKGRIAEGKVQLKLLNVSEKGAFHFAHDSFPADEKGLIPGLHAFMNDLVQALSGQKGLFDTRIWYVSKSGKGTKSILSAFMDGSDKQGVISNGSINLFPTQGPGGEVVYTSFEPGIPQIFMGKKRITHDDREYRGAQFSPDGRRMAVSVNWGGQSDIFLMDPPSGALGKNLTDDLMDDVSPAWSPDGSQLAFVSNRSGGPQIYLMNADGSGQHRITFVGYYNSTPDWCSNGLIAFTGLDEGQSDIFTVDVEGNIRRLTQDQGLNKDPRWGPGCRYITFVSKRSSKKYNLYIMTPDGRYQWPLLEKGGEYSTPWWVR
jgi:TolB protein